MRASRTTPFSRVSAVVLGVLVAVLAYAPYAVSRGTQTQLVLLFCYVLMGTMWNLLAGYGGMVSVGQQAYIGIGSYGLVTIADQMGVPAVLAVPLAGVAAGAVAWVTSFLVFRLAGGYFAIGTWVVAEVLRLVFTQVDGLGAGAGVSVGAYGDLGPAYRIAVVYWLALATTVLSVFGVYLLMRSRTGLGLTAVRDDPVAASSLGVGVAGAKRLVYVAAAVGCGMAGALIASNTLRVQPESAFSINYTAVMMFVVVIGGIGAIEGPILGAVLYFLLERELSHFGAWYLVLLGIVVVAFTLVLPKGLWGLVAGPRRQVFPVGLTVMRS
ncbi:ABC transporter permease [Lentzea aerocolonigenes]|uniref:ABC transporter permease n=1 Tax=Lentzea aerocolonigenes TaxID=68170 RepID=A0A0F0GZB2_LENAE|nr:branched-chain amino acid ABC transporter permease [Lentzea aerocolonigenes]KJK48615.1 ABC transporter permease [Lentzea aerocolonigenes]